MTPQDDPTTWTGVERRRQPSQDLGDAVTELQRLTGSISSLAKVHDQDKLDLRRQVFVVAAATVIAVITLLVVGDRGNDKLLGEIQRGHDEIACLLLIPEVSRDTPAQLNCREAVR